MILVLLVVFGGLLTHRSIKVKDYAERDRAPQDTSNLSGHQKKILAMGPPDHHAIREFERMLPQHNLSLPFPEGKKGRYVKFSNQIRMLGWNNCFNEV